MMRPFTILCAIAAAGSGLYLYSVKHRTVMLDEQIADTLHQADVARARTTELRASYALLNQPQRLTELSARYLSLHPMAVTQYVQVASLDAHLPPVQAFPRPGEADPAASPVSSPATTTDDDADSAAPADAPIAAAQPPTQPAPTREFAAAEPPRPLPDRAAPIHADTAHPGDLHAATRVADRIALPRARDAGLPGQLAGIRAQPMPMAAPRPVKSAVLATAALHPAGTPSRPRITNAEALYDRQPTRVAAAAGGSMLGGGGMALPPPVPFGN